MDFRKTIKESLWRQLPIAPLVSFRILFYGLICFGAIRFIYSGWLEQLYGEPDFYFKFFGFHWVPDLNADQMFWVFVLIAVSSLLCAVGLFYRLAAITCFLSFSLYELVDATNYLNHYYLVILLLLIMVFQPAHRSFSLDIKWLGVQEKSHIPAALIDLIKLQLFVVYFFAGLAKLNWDWMVNAMPLAVWLPSKADIPIIGGLLAEPFFAKLFSWSGAVYDLSIAFFLWNKRTRPFAYIVVIAFHLMVGLLFNIGLFPAIMILSTTIFFSAAWHEALLKKIGYRTLAQTENYFLPKRKLFASALSIYVFLQLLLPVRHVVYGGNVAWHEQGYRFGWRVMLVEKSGQARFFVKDANGEKLGEIDNSQFLTAYQEKQMAIQPDFILQYAHYLKKYHEEKYNLQGLQIHCDCLVAFNGRSSRQLIDPEVDLAAQKDSWLAKRWIQSLN